MIANRVFVLSFIFYIFLFQHHAVALDRARTSISVTEAKEVLATNDLGSIVKVMNDIKRFNTPELSAFAVDLWEKNSLKYPSLNWSIIASPRVRSEVANILIQADNNSLAKVNRDEIRIYAREMLMGTNEDAKRTNILTLGLIGNSGDISLLREIAGKEDPNTFRAAVIALAKMCGKSGQDALKDIRLRTRNDENRKFLESLGSSDITSYKRCD